MLVPTYGQAEFLRLRLLDRVGGLRERCIETFSSLAEHVTGLRLRGLMPPAVCDLVAEGVLREDFPEAAEQAGFRAEFLAAVKEIKENGAALTQAVDKARAHFPEGARGRRLFDACAHYVEAQGGRMDHADLLTRARDSLRTDARSYDLLLVDGFHDFTGLERQIVDLLADAAAETVVTLPLDPADRMSPVFVTAARTAAALGYRRTVELGENRRCTNPALRHLEQRLFTAVRDRVTAADAVEWIRCASDEDEADRLARYVAGSGRSFRDFLLIRRSWDGMHGLYRAAFRRHGIPLRFFGREQAGQTPAGRATALFLRALCGTAEPAELMPLLRSPWFYGAPPSDQVDRWARHLREGGDPTEHPGTPQVRDALHALSALKGSLPAVLAEHLGVRELLCREPDADEDTARAGRFFVELFAEAEAVAGLELADAAGRVLRRLGSLQVATPDRRFDCVYGVDVLDARQWEKPVVLVAGLSGESFPRRIRQDLFLRDDERQAFADEQGFALPLRARREDEERYLFYVALTRARERLVLTHPAFDEEGTPRPPSPYLDEALQHLDGPQPRDVPLAEQYVQPDDAVSTDDLLPIVADGLCRAGLGEGALAAALYDRNAVPRALLAWPRRLELIRSRPITNLPTDPARTLSASGINSFRRCPYLFLMGRVLRVRPARAQALDPLERGRIVHEVLEIAAREERDPGEIFDEIFAEQTRNFRLGLEGEAARRWMRGAVVRAVEELRHLPVEDVEYKFEVPVEDVILRGRIDRIDRYPAGALVRDYKTGKQKLDDAYAFENVQLDTYLMAVEDPAGAVFELLRVGERVGFVVPELKDEITGKGVQVLGREELQARREHMRGIVLEVARKARAGELAVHPRDPERCTRTKCDGYDLCRVARARWLAKDAREKQKRGSEEAL